jgi:catechol 2,3-dioxygenase-like lactoylglutathione lyase family enzyme
MPDTKHREERVVMLGNHDVGATLAVSDFDAARSFYEGTLGLAPMMEFPESVLYGSGNTRLMVYRSEFAGTNKATAATWGVGDELDSIVQDLRSKGVTFEHYDLPETTRAGDIHEMSDGMRGVWFKDPSGNIISLVNAT